jgi:hypothetical protein
MTKRRKIILDDDDEIKEEEKIDSSYNSGTSVHNFMLDDPIIDYYKLLDSENPDLTKESKENDPEYLFFNFITNQGTLFEKNVIEYMKKNIITDADEFVQISYSQEDIKSTLKYKETIDAINNKVPVIYQGVLHDYKTKTFGCPDLLVRNDYLSKITKKFIPIDIIETYYVIVDIKFNKLKLLSDGFTIGSYGRSIANKGQLIIYNRILSKIQNKEPKYMYILGRGNTYTKKSVTYNSNNCFDVLGHVDSSDTYLNYKVDKALEWLCYLKREHKEPNFIIPYPNMSNTYDVPYHNKKKEYAIKIEELTLLWNVGYKARSIAHKKGIYKLSDPLLNSCILEIGSSKGSLIDAILKINNNSNDIIKIHNEESIELREYHEIEFFLDFETINDIFDDFSKVPEISKTDFIFLIGLFVVNNISGYSSYYYFLADDLSKESEKKIFDDLNKIIDDYSAKSNDCMFYHWGSIEKTIYTKYCPERNINMCDLFSLFKNDKIVVKGAYSYSLKEIGSALYKNGFITNNYSNNKVSDGLNAMILAEKYYKNDKNDKEIMSNIIIYNQIDCEILCEILYSIRKYLL